MKIPTRHVHWKRCWRVIPTLYPSENLLKRVTEPKDRAAIEELDALTSTRLRTQSGEINFLQQGESLSAASNKYVAASFSYSISNESRFSDGSHGVYYGANSLTTSIAETVYHREKFMRATNEGEMLLPMRVIVGTLDGHLHDIRSLKKKYPAAYSSANYSESQKLGRKLWEEGSSGIVYYSVRHSKGECAAVFKPSLLHHCREDRALLYEWDGEKIIKVHQVQEFLKFKQD